MFTEFISLGTLLDPKVIHGAAVLTDSSIVSPFCSPCLQGDINHLQRLQGLATRMFSGFKGLTYTQRLPRPQLKFCSQQAEFITAFA